MPTHMEGCDMMRRWSKSKLWYVKPDRMVCTGCWIFIMYVGLVVAPTSWAAQVNPSALSFSVIQGGASPAPQTVSYSKTGSRTKTWTASSNMAWVSISHQSGTISTETDQITIGVNSAGMVAGTYTASVTILLQAGKSSERTILPVSVVVSDSPRLSVAPASLSFSAVAGGTNPMGQVLGVTNTGGGTLTWSASDNVNWLSLAPVSGTNNGTISATISVSGLAAGTYSGSITVNATSGGTKNVPVTLVLSPATSGTVTLNWLANTESDLAGYKIYRGTASGGYGSPIAILGSTSTSHTISTLQSGTTYFFVITAYDTAGNESSYSNEVSKSIY